MCLRLDDSNQTWVRFAGNDVFENSSNRDLGKRESGNQDIDAEDGSDLLEARQIRTKCENDRQRYRSRKISHLTDKIVIAENRAECVNFEVEGQVKVITSLQDENDGLKTKLSTITKRERRLRVSNIEGDDDGVFKSIKDKEAYITKYVEDVMNKMFTRTTNKRKAMVLTRMISEGKIFGGDGKDGYDTIFLGQARKKFEPWKVLQALDQDSRCGNFSTVEIMRQVEGLKKYERGIFHGKSAMSRVANELETHAEDYVPYSCYVSETGHRNIAFDNEAVLRNCLDAMGLTEKAEKQCVSICFTLDYAEVCSTTKRGHVLAGMKIIDKDAKHPITKELLFNYEPTDDSRNDGGVHANELLTCIPLHFVVGKESKSVFHKDLKPFFDFANDIRVNGLKARSDTENDLMPFEDITYPMDMSAEQKCFNLGGGV